MLTRAPWLRAHAALSIAMLATFARALPYPFQRSWDDGRFILDNPDVRRVSFRALESIVSAPHFQAYHPLHLLSYWLDIPWTNANPLAAHCVSLVLYVAAGNALMRAFAVMGCSPAAALIASFVCLLHPIDVEVASWATGRKDVLALGFASLSMLAHLRSQRFGDRPAWLARLAYLLAVLSKTTALPLPVVLVWFDVCLRKRRLRDALRAQVPSFALGAAIAGYVVTLWRGEQMIREGAGLFDRIAASLGHQLATAIWPSATSPMYTTSPHAHTLDWAATLGFLAILVSALLRGRRALAFALGAFVVLWLPVSNVVPMYFPFQDRYLSLPLVGLGFGVGAAIDRVAPRARRLALALGLVASLALALRTVQYEGAWRDELGLWGHAASTHPDAYYAWMKLGELRRDTGALAGAIRAYQRAITVDEERRLGHVALFQAVALRDERLRGLPKAAEDYARAYYTDLDDAGALRELATRLLEHGYLRAPELPLARALALQPVPDPTFEHAARVQFARGRPSLALFYLRRMAEPTRDPALLAAAARARAAFPDAPLL